MIPAKFIRFVLIGAAVSIGGCISAHYHGKTFKPTGEVKVFYSPRDLPPNRYQRIGTLEITADTVCSSEKIDRELREAAKARGADIAVVEFFDSCFSGHGHNHKSCSEEDCSCCHEKDPYRYKQLVRAALFRKIPVAPANPGK
ncbi:MAG: hypothetical protein PHV59_09585 [Victivallales bacterium]|nr:hypothetical protein [Victivallales bacterium]